MERFSGSLFVFVVMMLVSTAICKDLHTKENDKSGEKTLVINLLTNDEVFTKHERYIRHINPATESARSHIVKQMKRQFSPRNRGQSQNVLKNLINNLRKRLRKYVRSRKSGKKQNKNNNINNKSI